MEFAVGQADIALVHFLGNIQLLGRSTSCVICPCLTPETNYTVERDVDSKLTIGSRTRSLPILHFIVSDNLTQQES